ncbi:Mob1/phocein [Infundibulicybe gibba]|nr:Mob1/phocein [Infundibulicybe gibba]
MSFFGRNRPRSKRSPTPTRKDSAGTLEAPVDPFGGGPKPLYLSSPFADAALVKGNFKTIVVLPNTWTCLSGSPSTVRPRPTEKTRLTWLVFDFYTNLNEFLRRHHRVLHTADMPHDVRWACVRLPYPPGALTYLWMGRDGKTSTLSAPMYIDGVMAGIQALVEDENQFPTKSGQGFPPNFPHTIRFAYRQLLRVFAHIYHAHYPQILHLRSEPHFNSLFAHFLAFGTAYELLEYKDIKGEPNAPVGVGFVWERWKNAGILEG